MWSSGAERWRVVIADRIELAPMQTPRFRIDRPSLMIQLSPCTAVEMRVGGERQRRILARGDASVFAAGVPRELRHPAMEVLLISLSADLVTRAADERSSPSRLEICDHPQLRDPLLLHIGLALEAEVQAGFPSGRVYGESLGLALAAHLMSGPAARAPDDGARRGGIAPAPLRRVLEFIDAHLGDELRVRTLAAIAGLSEHRFAHNFKQATGLAPHRYVVRRRVERARQMLRETNMTVTSVAHELGFGSASRFAIVFRRAAGASPSSFRASCR